MPSNKPSPKIVRFQAGLIRAEKISARMSAMTENADEKKSIREASRWKLWGVRDFFDARRLSYVRLGELVFKNLNDVIWIDIEGTLKGHWTQGIQKSIVNFKSSFAVVPARLKVQSKTSEFYWPWTPQVLKEVK